MELKVSRHFVLIFDVVTMVSARAVRWGSNNNKRVLLTYNSVNKVMFLTQWIPAQYFNVNVNDDVSVIPNGRWIYPVSWCCVAISLIWY